MDLNVLMNNLEALRNTNPEMFTTSFIPPSCGFNPFALTNIQQSTSMLDETSIMQQSMLFQLPTENSPVLPDPEIKKGRRNSRKKPEAKPKVEKKVVAVVTETAVNSRKRTSVKSSKEPKPRKPPAVRAPRAEKVNNKPRKQTAAQAAKEKKKKEKLPCEDQNIEMAEIPKDEEVVSNSPKPGPFDYIVEPPRPFEIAKPYFRECLPAEGMIRDLITVGSMFSSFDDFANQLKTWKQFHFHPMRMVKSELLRETDGTINTKFCYRSVELKCDHNGNSHQIGRSALAVESHSDFGCNVAIRLIFDPDVKKLKITTMKTTHNHPIFDQDFSKIELDSHAKFVDDSLICNSIDASKLHISSRTCPIPSSEEMKLLVQKHEKLLNVWKNTRLSFLLAELERKERLEENKTLRSDDESVPDDTNDLTPIEVILPRTIQNQLMVVERQILAYHQSRNLIRMRRKEGTIEHDMENVALQKIQCFSQRQYQPVDTLPIVMIRNDQISEVENVTKKTKNRKKVESGVAKKSSLPKVGTTSISSTNPSLTSTLESLQNYILPSGPAAEDRLLQLKMLMDKWTAIDAVEKK